MLSNVSKPAAAIPHRRGLFLRALALASLAIAGLILPFVWNLLELVNQMPKMQGLQDALAQWPVSSWIMMFALGACIPATLLAGLHRPGHRVIVAATMLVLMWVAVTWYVHMPAMGLCSTLYPQSELACSALQWAGSMSLGLATAAYVFLMLGLAISALDLLVQGLDDDPVHAGQTPHV